MKNIYHGVDVVNFVTGTEISSNIGDSLAGMIDHTLLNPDATKEQIIQLCAEAKKFKFACVCVNPCYVSLCAQELKGTQVNVCTVIGFPLGASTTAVKIFETEQALHDGAKEIDIVINVGMLKSGDETYVEKDISVVVTTARKYGAVVKVIIETSLLTDAEKVRACLIAKLTGADFVKTSTGFSKGGATVHDVALLRKTVGPLMGVKASGGIRSRKEAIAMIKAGASRIGTSAGVELVGGITFNTSVKKSKQH